MTKIFVISFFILLTNTTLFSQNVLNKASFKIGDDFNIIEKNEGRIIYQTVEGVTFAISAKKTIKKEENLPFIAGMSMLFLSENLLGFELLFDEKDYIINHNNYCYFVYNHLVEGEKVVVYSFHTAYNNKLVNISFTLLDTEFDLWKERIMEIMNSFYFEKL